MTYKEMLIRATRDLNRAEHALQNAITRPNVTDFELERLRERIVYLTLVGELIKERTDGREVD